jgi:hypothetical protein
VLAVVPCVACEPELDGLTNLIDAGYSYVEFPGRRVLGGNFERVELDALPDGRAFVLGRDRSGTLANAPFEGGSQCELSSVADFVPSRRYPAFDSNVPRFVPYSSAIDGALGFMDQHCRVPQDATPGAALPLVASVKLDPPRFLTTRAVADERAESVASLLACDPWAVAGDGCVELGLVGDVKFGRESVWTLELVGDERRLVRRDRSLVEELALGAGVSAFVPDTRNDGVVFLDGADLQVLSAPDAMPTIVETDACDLSRVYDPFGRGEGLVSYVAPCEAGRLVVLDTSTGERTELSLAGRSPVLVVPESPETRSLYCLSDAAPFSAPPARDRDTPLARADRIFGSELPREVGTLHALRSPDGDEVGPKGALLASVTPWTATSVGVLADFDGTTGRLVEWDRRTQTVREIARRVLDFGPNWVLADFDGSTGTLLELRSDFSTAVVARGVPDSPQSSIGGCILGSPRCFTNDLQPISMLMAVLRDFDGAVGELVLFHPGSPGDPLGEPELIARSVRRKQYGVLLEGDAVVYLSDYRDDEGLGRLSVRFVPSADRFDVKNVRAWSEIFDPMPGILYTTTAGAWFARLR